MKRLLITTLLFSGITAFPSFANGVLSEKNLSFALAEQLAQHAIQSCVAKNVNVAVTIVDRAGVVKLAKRMDNAGPHTLEASRMKAFTALTTTAPTENVMKNAQANAEAKNLHDILGFLLLAGGVQVKVEDQTIGAIGIGGAPSGSIDQQCALDAIEAVKAQLSAK
ncbi:heme-binding protein [Candidatus Symbiopectobacterium sp.]|uniref:GlcG/HbpS family heme-binding protein n=1 Tax=Candidatus Symbiopectobacterium sp. TaxID=2816440 RepID=UPI0025C1293E|nr:heme-binding protein [Candidatus Symbiopectobacterium sp.]